MMLFLLSQAAVAAAHATLGDQLVELYRKAQFPLMAGMLALAGAAWAALNFIWKLKESCYDSKAYEELVAELQDVEPSLKVMPGFDHLRSLDITVIFAALGAALLQVSLGFVYAAWSSIVCFAAAIVVIGGVILVVTQIFRTSSYASRLSEASAQQRINKMRSERKEAAGCAG